MHKKVTLDASLCRAARGLLGWTQDDLAVRCGVAKATILRFEIGTRQPYERTLRDIQQAFEDAGVEFLEPIDNEALAGLRLRKTPSTHL